MELRKIDCPVCLEKEFKTVTTEDGFYIVRCTNCSFVFTNPLPPEDFFRHKYEREWLKDIKNSDEKLNDYFKRQTSSRKRIYQTALNDIQKYVRVPSIIDIGSGTGAFLFWAKKLGLSCAGIELSKEEAKFAKKTLAVPVYTEPFSQHLIKNVHYSAITMFDVLEHIPQPNLFLRDISRYQMRDDLLVLTVPNGPFIIYALVFLHRLNMLNKFKIGPDNHVNHFNKNTLTRLLENSGYEILKIEATHPDLFYINNTVFYKIFKVLYTYFFRFIDKVANINFTTSIYCIAKRK